MFKCQGEGCGKLVGPGVSPIIVVAETRAVEYRRRDPETKEIKVSTGFETVRERKLCPHCAGVVKADVKVEPVNNHVSFLKSAAKQAWEHSRRCHRPLADCKACQNNIRWFSGLSLLDAATALAGPVQRVFAMHLEEANATASH